MKLNNSLHIIPFVFFVQFNFGQNTSLKEIQGQITDGNSFIENVSILNVTTENKVVSEKNGLFSIAVNEGDILVFSSVNLKTLEVRIKAEDLRKDVFLVKMAAKEIELEEVVVNTITAENLGIIPKGQKKYTAAERKLATAGDFKPVMLLGLLGGSMQLDPLINKINGRTKKLKKLVALEQKEANIEKLGLLFDDAYFVDYLKIPAEHINGFKFYFVENENADSLLKLNDKPKLSLLMSEMALKFNEILALENK